jgi:hypothetical protein
VLRWTLCRAVCVAALRRARPALAANPALAALAAFAAVGVPVGAFAAGRSLSDAFAVAVGDPVAARSLALGLAATGLAAGVAIGLLAPGPGALGAQLTAAPVSRSTLVFATSLAPVGLAAAPAALPALLFAVPLAGVRAAPALLALAAATALGAAGAEAARAVAACDAAGLAALAAAGVAWLLPALLWGEGAETGPLAAFVVSLTHGAVVLPALTAAATTTFGAAIWLAACSRRPATRVPAAPSPVLLGVPRLGPAAVVATTLKRIGRRSELRAHVVAAVVLPAAAAYTLALLLNVRGEALLGFGAALALTAVAVLPSVALGLQHEQSWLVRSAPQGRACSACSAGAGGMLAGGAILAAVATVTAPVAHGDPSAFLQIESAAAFVLGCGAIAGALVPWRSDRVLQQLAAFGALLGVVLVLWLAAGRVERRLELPADAFAVVAGNLVAVAGLVAAGARGR